MPLFDTDHIVSFNKEREGQEPFQGKPPYISVFEKDGKRLLFVATQHHAGAETGNSFVTIDVALGEKPTAVVVESYRKTLTAGNLQTLDDIAARDDPKFSGVSEIQYAAMRAKQAGVAILGGEPPLSEEVQALQTQGYSIPDMCSYYFLRQIPQYKRENNPLVENPEALLEAFMQRMHAGLPAIQEQDLSYSQFLTVFKERLGVDFDIASITPTLVRGENEPGSNFFQKIGHHVGLRRDPNLLRVIDEALEQNACVMVAYGAGHLVTLRPALEAGLGASVDSQPFPPGVLPRLFPEGMGAANEAVKQGRKATRAEDPPPRP